MPDRAALHEAIRAAADPLAVLDRIVQQSLALIPSADGASLEMRRDADTLEYLSAAGTLAQYIGLRLPIDDSFSGLALRTGQVEHTGDARVDPRVNAQAVAVTGVVSMLCVPLSSGRRGIAVLKVSARQPNAFTDRDAQTLHRLASFLQVTVAAASDLAQVTAGVLAELDGSTAVRAAADPPSRLETARFVANVLAPGLADEVDATDLIRDVLTEERLAVVVQPIVDLATGRIDAVEALARFPGPPSRPPDWWFAAAQAVGLGPDLELLAVRTALRLLPDLPAGVRMSVNVGPHAVLHPGFGAVFADLPLERITVELTEHSEVGDYDAVLGVLGQLRQRGALLSVDDTGSGYSGLSHIMRVMPDVIKLDRDLTVGVHDDPVRHALATALADFAGRIDASVTAEGIEHDAEAQTLREIGVHHGQGYLFGRPMPVDDLRDLLSA